MSDKPNQAVHQDGDQLKGAFHEVPPEAWSHQMDPVEPATAPQTQAADVDGWGAIDAGGLGRPAGEAYPPGNPAPQNVDTRPGELSPGEHYPPGVGPQ